MLERGKLICPYCYERDNHILGKTIHTYKLKLTAGYRELANYKDYLNIFILKDKAEENYTKAI